MKTLSNKHEDICTYTGLFGCLLGLTCLIQFMVIMGTHWLVFMVLIAYLYSIISFILLSLQKPIAPVLLIISAVFILATETLFTLSGVFSLALLLMFLYNVVVVVLLFVERIPVLLKEKARAIQAEREAWEGKI